MLTIQKPSEQGWNERKKSAAGLVRWLGSAGERDPGGGTGKSAGSDPAEREDLPYRVELWDERKTAVEQVLAVTANASIGYAAYYAATREFPNRCIMLRHKNNVVSRWNGPGH